MTNSGFARHQLRSFVHRLEHLEEERAAITSDMKEVRAEAKGVGFDTKIIFVDFYQVISFFGSCIRCQVNISLYTTEHVYTKISNAVAVEFYLNRETDDYGFNFFCYISAQVGIGIFQLVEKIPFCKDQLRIKTCFKTVGEAGSGG